MADKQCPENHRWCPIQKKCVPQDDEKGKGKRQGRGQGKGPMGKPAPDKVEEAYNLVDVILTGNYQEHKNIQEADEVLDEVLDEIENKIDNVPDQDMPQLQDDVIDDIAGSDDDGSENDLSKIENRILQTTRLLIKEEDFRAFFKGMLKKWKIDSPVDLNDSQKKEFFSAVDREWKSKKES